MSKKVGTLSLAIVTLGLAPFWSDGHAAPSEVVVKAVADECYNGIGGNYVEKFGDGDACPTGWLEKTNQTYGWALTKSGDDVWVGTGANVSCIAATAGSFFAGEPIFFQAPPGESSLGPGPFPAEPPFTDIEIQFPTGPGQFVTITPEAADYVLACEGAEGDYLYQAFPLAVPLINRLTDPLLGTSLLGLIGDWRPAEVWVHDTSVGGANQTRVPIHDPRIHFTLGLRAAGAKDGVVLMAGPGILGLGLQVFAFDADTKELIDSRLFARYSNARRFVTLRNQLYVGVQNTDGSGSVLLWTGSRANFLKFQVVGTLDSEVAQLATFGDRLVATTWPPSQLSSVAGVFSGAEAAPPGLWISPRVPFFGLRWWHRGWWSKLWEYSEYDPDPVIAAYSGLGDLRQFGQCLYYGSMHPPQSGSQGIRQEYDEAELVDTTDDEIDEKAYRSLAVFRICPAESLDVELLYGEKSLPVYTPGVGWEEKDNGLGEPKYGQLADRAQNYFWSMGFLGGELCFGTQETSESSQIPAAQGGDLWCFPDTDSAATAFDNSGLGNKYNSGYRNMVEANGSLYLATSNGANLNPDGGFELIRLDPDSE